MRRLCSMILLGVFLVPMTEPAAEDSILFPTEVLQLSTFQNTSVGGTLAGYGIDDTALYYTITAEPVKGELELCEDGSFIYTPREGKQGRDTFQYQILGTDGRLMKEVFVSIQIERLKNGVWYEDMQGRPEAYAAAMLSEKGLFTGEQVVGRYCFCPEKAVTRGEFLSICMSLSGRPLLSAVCATGYADDAAIPVWMKSFVTTASMQGIQLDDPECFDPGAALTESEAAELAEQILGLSNLEQWKTEDLFDRADMARLLGEFL